jgi:secreted Zn-dependent insulinase-like peptidase
MFFKQEATGSAEYQLSKTSKGSLIEVSSLDKKKYDILTLPNGLNVILVSDPDAQQSAAVMQVAAGSLHEPDEFPGLAHYLEHVLFLGTEKYPDKSEYLKFIEENGGKGNAWTEDYYTVFHFDISPSAFADGLDRFAQFFISPTFNPEFLEKERSAVDSEYKMHVLDDNFCIKAINRWTSNIAHPAHRFSIGNLSTLTDRPEQTLEEAVK